LNRIAILIAGGFFGRPRGLPKPGDGDNVRPGKGVVRSMPATAGTAEITVGGARHDDVKWRKR
jgi:hypothetical protein